MQHEDHNLTAADDATLTRLLDRKPAVAVPEGFAARVAASLPPQKRRRAVLPAGRVSAAACAFLVTLTMFALAGRSHPALSNFAFDMELLMLVQLCGIGWYFAQRRES